MKIITTIEEMQQDADRFRSDGKKISLVATMGFLHEGHLSLVREARQRSDVVVMSIFVNPTQFARNEDFKNYPRDFERDAKLAEAEGCDIIFYPEAKEMYPDQYLTFVEVEGITKILCGASRPTHFRGVTTIVAKLFNIIKPHVAVFGQKDAQQAIAIKRMTNDLNFDIEIIVAPIFRESDGLAMSSRNTYLAPDERKQALCLFQSLKLAEQEIAGGERNVEIIKNKMTALIDRHPKAVIDYIEFVDPETLNFIEQVKADVLTVLAVKIGKTRLIDNSIFKFKR